MTKKELIEALRDVPDDALIEYYDGYVGGYDVWYTLGGLWDGVIPCVGELRIRS